MLNNFRISLLEKFIHIIKKFIWLLKNKGIKVALLKTNSFLFRYNEVTNYNKWIKLYYNLGPDYIKKIKRETTSLKVLPLISVIMPTYNSNTVWLKEAIDSVRNQTYTNWELCIADDSSTSIDCIEMLKYYKNLDSRIKVVFREENGHISEASNSALKISNGDWIVLFDHDDLLSIDALFWLVYTINNNSECSLIYSDEDKIDENGMRCGHYFKPDFNYDLFLSQNMISHLGAYKLNIVNKIGGFRKGYEGSQDYDLALRYMDEISNDQIIHIPRVLYHWRIHNDSTAKQMDKKPYALESARNAINEHLSRKGVKANVKILENNMYRVRYHLPEDIPGVSIIIPTCDNYKMLKICIDSLLTKTDYPEYEIIIVNNNSKDDYTLKYLKSLSKISNIKIIEDNREFNFSSINNRAVENVTNKYICFLNDDTEVITPNWLSEMMSFATQPGVGAVGAKLWYFNDTLQHAGIITGIGGVAGHSHKYMEKGNEGYLCRANLIQSFSAVTAACLLVSKKIFEEAGGFDEANLSIAFNDVDFCLKIQKLGYRNIWTPYAELYHHESASRGIEDNKVKQIRFSKEVEFMKNKWGDKLINDTAYSPNLSLDYEDYSLAWPPRVKNI